MEGNFLLFEKGLGYQGFGMEFLKKLIFVLFNISYGYQIGNRLHFRLKFKFSFSFALGNIGYLCLVSSLHPRHSESGSAILLLHATLLDDPIINRQPNCSYLYITRES
jgi:hypothetical protein